MTHSYFYIARNTSDPAFKTHSYFTIARNTSGPAFKTSISAECSVTTTKINILKQKSYVRLTLISTSFKRMNAFHSNVHLTNFDHLEMICT